MGTNKRYAGHYDRLMDDRIQKTAMVGEPASFTPAELELDNLPLTRTPKPIEALAWIRYGDVAMKIPVRVVAWTSRAVAVKWDGPDGEQRAWVWASAVEQSR